MSIQNHDIVIHLDEENIFTLREGKGKTLCGIPIPSDPYTGSEILVNSNNYSVTIRNKIRANCEYCINVYYLKQIK